MTWCGPYKSGWGGPCKLDVSLAFCFLLNATLCSGFQFRKLRLLRGRCPDLAPRADWVAWIYFACGTLHLAWFLVSCFSKQTAAFQILTQAVFVAAWALVLVGSTSSYTSTLHPIKVHFSSFLLANPSCSTACLILTPLSTMTHRPSICPPFFLNSFCRRSPFWNVDIP